MTQPQSGAFLLFPIFDRTLSPARVSDRLEEARGLVRAIGLEVLEDRVASVARPVPASLIGKGLREEIGARLEDLKPEVVIVNATLSPVQQRNLEKAWQTKVIDRTGLILEIFGERAQTKEGKIQVELAALSYQRSRLVRSWTHLERQRGGAGFMGGPGETQIELDRRLIDTRISRLKKDIEDVRRTRRIQRESREKVPFPVVSLVGYTNAGKSTLFNRLTGANVFAEDLPFATLDPTMRRLTLPGGQPVILSDTVGFIADLPTHLVAAFRATLEQVQYADVILHVCDVSGEEYEYRRTNVISILKDLGVDYENDPRVLEVFNKIDLADPERRGEISRRIRQDSENTLCLSALTGEGVSVLVRRVESLLERESPIRTFVLDPREGEALAWLYRNANIVNTEADESGQTILRARLSERDFGKYQKQFRKEQV